MKTLPVVNGRVVGDAPTGYVRAVMGANDCVFYEAVDQFPQLPDAPPDPLIEAFLVQQQAKQSAEFEAFKSRAGQPSYKAAAVKIAAEKLGMLDAIDAAIVALVDKASDKALYVWWAETDAISRGDAQWQQIEAAVAWGKGASADDLFDLASQI